MKTPAYAVEEMGGVIWAYLGPAETKPLLPRLDGFVAEGTIRMLGTRVVPCNWLQIMENSLDPVHTEWLHGHTYEFIKEQKGQAQKVAISAHHEKIAFREFDHGITKHRLLTGQSEDCDDWKVGHPIVFPNILSVGAGDERVNSRYYAFQIRVPVDDTHTLHLWYTAYVPPKGAKVAPHLLDKVHTYDVPYKDKNGDFILDNVDAQDIMAWITQGAIADRTSENLGASDNGIALYRRVLRREIKKVEEGLDPMFTFRDPAQERAHRSAERGRQAPQRRGHAELDHAHPRRAFADRRGRVPDVRGAQARAQAAARRSASCRSMSDKRSKFPKHVRAAGRAAGPRQAR